MGVLRTRWQPLKDEKAQSRLDTILQSWIGTPYVAGNGYRGVAGDCVRATVLILCEWLRHPVPELSTMPADASLHNRKGTMRGFTRIRRALPKHHRVRSGPVRPGDLLITGPVNGGPGHAIIVGAEGPFLYQTIQGAGFHRMPWALCPKTQHLFAVLRFEGYE